MRTIQHTAQKLVLSLLAIVSLLGAGFGASTAHAAACSPTVTKDVYAKTGSAILYGSTAVTIWGYASQASDPAGLPGPVLDVSAGDCVQVTLHNVDIPESTSLLIQAQDIIPDTLGVAAGGSKSYVFAASNPGTFLYEAGLTPNGQHHVAMGLYGALIVRPATLGQAYSSASTAFNKESLMVLSEIDTALNNSGSPSAFDMRKYQPKYLLINGKAYPGTGIFSVGAGDKVLLRYVNAGMQTHAMSTLGLSQTVIAQDGSPYEYSHNMVAETIATGQTLDTLVTIPGSAADGTKFAIYDANMLLRNNTGAGANSTFGGMLTFLQAGGPPPAETDTTGPAVTTIGLSPSSTNGASAVTVNATLSDTATGNANITQAEFYVDSTSNPANVMTAVDLAFDSPTESVIGTLSTAMLATLSSGSHTIFVRGKDANNNWGAFRPATLNVDKTGPATSGLTLSPNPSSGAVTVSLTATGNDTNSGNTNVTAAEYWVDSGVHTAMTIVAGSASPTRSFTATILAGLSMGSHIVSVRSQDAFGNWGTPATITLQVADTLPPVTSNVVASPNPNNGYQGFNTSIQAVRVTANFSDAATGGSNIVAAEGFIDTTGTTGTGFAFIPTDGSFNSPSESGYGDIPLAVISALSNGNHTILVHTKDAPGNWSVMSTTVLVINKSLYFSTAGNTNPPNVGGTADDADIYLWNGTAFSRVLDVSAAPYSLPSGANVDGFDRVNADHFYMSFNASVTLPVLGTVQDEDVVYYNAGTWSLYYDGSVRGVTDNVDAISIVGGNLYISLATNTNPPGAGGTGDDADIYRWNGSSTYTRVVDASTIGIPSSGGSNANTDGFVWVDATHFYMSFAADTTISGVGAVQDEDIVYYNAGTWVVIFDGTGKGLTNNNHDIDAFDIP